MLIFGLITGLVLGALLMNLAVEEEKDANNLLKKTINNLEDDLDNANLRVENRDNLIKDLQKERVTLLENVVELRAKIAELQNKKELVETDNQTN